MLNLIVAGGGEGFYKNLYPSVKMLKDDIKIYGLIDIKPKEELHEKTQKIIGAEGIAYYQNNRLDAFIDVPKNPAAIIMTPNASHLEYARLFATHDIPVYVEKPAVVNLADLYIFLELAKKYPKLIYAAEYCVEGKALGFMFGAGMIEKSDPRLKYLSIDGEPIPFNSGEFGRLRTISGKLLEGEGSTGTADHRRWLLDGNQAGMIRDLLSHLFGPLYDAGLVIDATLGTPEVTLGYHENGSALGTYRKLNDASEGETYARINGRFLTPRGTPEFEFYVGKYWPKHDRVLELVFEKSYVKLNHEKPFICDVKFANWKSFSTKLNIDHYSVLSMIDFLRFCREETHGHIGRAAAIVRFNETMRAIGLEQACLR